MSGTPSRRDRRRSFADTERIALLEDDLDMSDVSVRSIEGKVDRAAGILTGILVTLSTASVLLGLNLVVER